jgi:hypothetical protein
MSFSTIKVVLSQTPVLLTTENPIKEYAKQQVQDAVMGALEAIGQILVEASFSLALVGGGICTLLWLGGWKNGARWIGILIMAHVVIRVLIGG